MNRRVWIAIGAAALAIVLLAGVLMALHSTTIGDVTNQAASTSMYEDAPHTSGDRGNLMLGVRNDAGTALAADGDYMTFTFDSSGKLHVADVTVSASSKAASTSYTHDPAAANTAAQIVLAAGGSGVNHVIGMLSWSYLAAPTNGGITLEDETGTVWQVDVTSAGPGFFLWDPPLLLAANDAVTATLVAAGSGVTGTINIHTWTE